MYICVNVCIYLLQYAAEKTRKNFYIVCKEKSKNNVNERCKCVCLLIYSCVYVKAKVKNVSYVYNYLAYVVFA